MNARAMITTERLALVPWNVELIDGFLTGNRALSESALEVVFPEPFGPPPETGDVLEMFRAGIASDTSGGAFVPQLIVRREDCMAVGGVGLGPLDESGVSTFGYSVYPRFEGQGYASEAASALVEWGLRLADVSAIRATIAPGHTASELVSSRAGLTMTGEQINDEKEGMLNVWERSRES